MIIAAFGTGSIYAEKTIFELPKILINGGKRGFLVEIDPRELRRVIPIVAVNVAITEGQ